MKPSTNTLFIYPEKSGEKITAEGIIYDINANKKKLPILKGEVWLLGKTVNAEMRNDNIVSEGSIVTYFPEGIVNVKFMGKNIHIIHKSMLETLVKQ
jgi:hypothetical protein